MEDLDCDREGCPVRFLRGVMVFTGEYDTISGRPAPIARFYCSTTCRDADRTPVDNSSP